MRKRHPRVQPEDESWVSEFPHDAAEQLIETLDPRTETGAIVIRAGWTVISCDFAPPEDRRTIEVILQAGGGRRLQVRFRAKHFSDPEASASDPPSARYPSVGVRLAEAASIAISGHPAGFGGWLEC